jgi:two-component system, OmpR family, phosphate regulon sensor histidine kinase PhoR
MQVQAERMSHLIEDLLSLSRVEMRQHVPPTDLVDVTGVIGEATQALTKVATDAGITIVEPAVPATAPVIGDRDELMQVVQNLMQNAIKYGRRGGHVRVSLAVEGNRVALTIADDGIGVAPHDLARLTERFFRVSTKDSRERGGTGLGLAIVKHIVNRHRGELRIDSTLGKGSSFTVLLPSA